MKDEEIRKTLADIISSQAQPAGAPPPASSSHGATFDSEAVAQIVELARKEALDPSKAEQAKLDFAGGAAWAIATFGVGMIAIVAWLAIKRTLQPSKLIALGLIVTSALLLVVLGYTDEQMSPVIGLLGTIAGYMLGSKEWDGNDAVATAAADAKIAAANDTSAIDAAAKAQQS